MIPSSVTCGCECSESTSTPITPTTGATGTAGCSGANVACVTVLNGAVVSISDRVLPGISGATGSAGCSGDSVPCITVANGAVTSVSNRSLGLGTASSYNVPATGNATSGQVVLGSDTRLTDSRTPTSHASTHTSAGSDPLTLSQSQITNLTSDLSAKAPLASPTFTGTPAAPTPAADTNTPQLATTAYVIGQGYLKSATAASTYAPIASPTFTGTPASTTAAADTNTPQIATTAYVIGQASSSNPAALGTVSPGSSAKFSRGDHVHPRQITALGSEVSGLLPFGNLTNATAGSILLGRGSSGSGVFQEISLGTNLSMSGTTLNAGTSSVKYRADFCILDSVGDSNALPLANNNTPYPDPADYAVFKTEFVPSNFTISAWIINATGNSAGNVGFALQYTTANPPTSGWTDVSGSTLNVNGTTSAFKFVTSTVSIGGSPSDVFWRLKIINTTSADASCSRKSITLSLWN